MNLKTISINRMIMSYLLALYCMFLPFEELFSFSFGSLLKPLGLVIMGLSFVFLIPTRFVVKRDWLWILVWGLICAASAAWSLSFSWWKYFFSIYLGQLLFCFLVAHLPLRYVNLAIVKKGLIFGAAIAAVILIFFPTQSSFDSEGRRTIILLGAHMDPNILATILCIAFYCLLSLYHRGKSIVYKAIFAMFALLLVVGIFLTGSRGVVIALVSSLLVVIALFMIKSQRKTSAIYILLGIAAVFLILYFVLPDNLLANRFSDNTILGLNEYSNKAHNRYTIWQNAFQLIIKQPLFGYGCGNFLSAIETIYIRCGAHNLIILELVELGIVGSIPLFVFLTKLAIRVKRSDDILLFGMLVALFITALTLDTLSNKYFWVSIILLSLGVRHKQEEGALRD